MVDCAVFIAAHHDAPDFAVLANELHDLLPQELPE